MNKKRTRREGVNRVAMQLAGVPDERLFVYSFRIILSLCYDLFFLQRISLQSRRRGSKKKGKERKL